MTPISTRKTQLEARHAFLNARLHHIETELEDHDTKDWDDLAAEREGDEVLEGMGQSGQSEMRQIEAALGRIAYGSYGICVTCGQKVSDERLYTLPATPFCRDCAV